MKISKHTHYIFFTLEKEKKMRNSLIHKHSDMKDNIMDQTSKSRSYNILLEYLKSFLPEDFLMGSIQLLSKGNVIYRGYLLFLGECQIYFIKCV